MKKVKWNDFAKRRKIDLEMFQNMTYEEYAQWCSIRSVEPVPKDSYLGVQNMLLKTYQDVEVYSLPEQEYSEKELKKLKKQDLITLCVNQSIELDGGEVKRSLIDLLLKLNKS